MRVRLGEEVQALLRGVAEPRLRLLEEAGPRLHERQAVSVIGAPGAMFEITIDVRHGNPDRLVRRVFDEDGNVAMRPATATWAPPSKGF